MLCSGSNYLDIRYSYNGNPTSNPDTNEEQEIENEHTSGKSEKAPKDIKSRRATKIMLNLNLSNNIMEEESEDRDPLGLNLPVEVINEEDESNLEVASNISRIVEKEKTEQKPKQEQKPKSDVKQEKEKTQTSISHEKCT